MTLIDFAFMLAAFSVIGLIMTALVWVLEQFNLFEEPFEDRPDPYDWAKEDEL